MDGNATENPQVSIIVPAYNPGSYLRIAAQSVLAQCFTDWEMLIVDDGSTEAISAQVPTDPRIRVIRQNNLGLAGARNTGIQQSRGTYLAFLDADDIWFPTKLQRQVDLFTARPDITLCDTCFEIINENGIVVGPGYQGYHKSYLELLEGCGICVSTVMMKRSSVEVVGAFDSGVPGCEDYDMWLKISKQFSLARVDSCEAQYRIHPLNMSRNYSLMYQNFRKVLKKHQMQARASDDDQAARAVRVGFNRAGELFASQAIDQARQAFRNKKLISTLVHLEAALKISPRAVAKSLARKIVP